MQIFTVTIREKHYEIRRDSDGKFTGGVILDPFMGSGSTGVAAELEEFGFIGIDSEQEAFDIACRRIEASQPQPKLSLLGNHGGRG